MKFKQIVARSFEDWKRNGFCQKAIDLNAKIGEDYFDTSAPHFFTGNVHAELAVVHLNPKRDKADWGAKCEYSDFDTYWDRFERFGYYTYGKGSKRKPRGGFDAKQLVFLKPFGILPVTGDKYGDLETSIDRKLQLELVPFGSSEFNYHKVGVANLEPFIEILTGALLEAERRYIIFCGRVFEDIFKKYIVKTHSFHLVKKDGAPTARTYRVTNIKLTHREKEITACIAPHFAVRGCPIERYGEKVFDLYGKI